MPDVPPHRGGRPKQFDQVISLRLSTALYDDLIRLARQRNQEVAHLMRDILRRGAVVQNVGRDLT